MSDDIHPLWVREIGLLREYAKERGWPSFTETGDGDLLRRIREENVELNALFDLQLTRMSAATSFWQHFNPGNDLVLPDLGRLLEWLMDQANLDWRAQEET
jgi:hypothetical protein